MRKSLAIISVAVQLVLLLSLIAASFVRPTFSVNPDFGHSSSQATMVNSKPVVNEIDSTSDADPASKKKKVMKIADSTKNSTSVEISADITPPAVEGTNPQEGERRVAIDSIINATFSESMNASTINEESFTVRNELGELLTGTVSYDPSSMTATFEPEGVLDFGGVYSATLSDAAQDEAGNSLQTASWSFTAGGRIRIQLLDVQTSDFLNGSAFTIAPNPFTLQDSLLVEDNGIFDSDFLLFGESRDGIILVDNVENNFTTYVVSETTVPEGYSKIYGDSIVTVVQSNACEACVPVSILGLQNLLSSVNITDVEDLITVARPALNRTQFELYNGKVVVGVFSGIQGNIGGNTAEIVGPGSGFLPQGYLATNNTLDRAPVTESFNFDIAASPTLTGAEIIDLFEVPTYPGPIEDFAPFITYAVPALVIPYEGSANNFVLTPVIDKVYPGLTVLLNQSSFVESQVASVRQVSMTFGTEGTLVGFSFGISDTPPPGTPEPPLDVPALFLDVGFVGDVDFSNSQAFQSSPKVDVVVNKTIAGFDQLEDGCADFQMLIFNEESEEWEIVEKLRNPNFDTEEQCGFTLLPEHFSKFAVGGVNGQTVSTDDPSGGTEDRRNGRSGGGSRSAGITYTPSGNDIERTINVGSESVTLEFASVESDSGQLKVESTDLSAFEEIFSDIAIMPQDNNEHGIVRVKEMTYSTTGKIFDIDASSVKFQGMVNVTIPYDERVATLLSDSESNVRFLHYDEELGVWEDNTVSVDENANTVTGMLDSLSAVTSAVVISKNLQVNPPGKAEISNVTFAVSDGTDVVSLFATLSNMERNTQNYVVIVQIVDENEIVQHIEWQSGTLASNTKENFSMSWETSEKRTYTVKIFLWTEMVSPFSLSDPAHVLLRL